MEERALTTSMNRDPVAYKSMREYMMILEERGLLKRITAPVDLDYEVGAISYRDLVRTGPGLLFENIKDNPDKQLVTNIMYSLDQLAIAFNGPKDWVKLHDIVKEGMSDRMASVKVDDGPVKEVKIFGEDVDLGEIPTPLWHELDGGRYIATTAGVVTVDPQTGAHNMGQYRSMIIDRNHTTVKIQGDFKVGATPPKGSTYGGAGDRNGAVHVLENEAEGKNTPCAIALGMDPLLVLAAGTAVPENEGGLAEYEAAGAWAGRPVELVKCETIDVWVPAESEYILEGEIIAGERHFDGPHGESSGFYNKNYEVFVFQVNAITHRKDPINFGLICGRIEDYPRPLMRSGSILQTLVSKSGLTNIREVHFPDAGAGGVIVIRAKIEAEGRRKGSSMPPTLTCATAGSSSLTRTAMCGTGTTSGGDRLLRGADAACPPGGSPPASARTPRRDGLHPALARHGHRRDPREQDDGVPRTSAFQADDGDSR